MPIIEDMGETTIEHVKEWWEGDGRGEHLVDLALPHEDHDDDTIDPDFKPGVGASLAAAACVLVCLGAVASVIVAFVLDVL
jgi:hypothetical protein